MGVSLVYRKDLSLFLKRSGERSQRRYIQNGFYLVCIIIFGLCIKKWALCEQYLWRMEHRYILQSLLKHTIIIMVLSV
ncbi:hypothetical protein K469DRAFT_69894 [Zopfia rhizophila CBS 207.26]|uniref:Uncharacterized protein n=1 Tax=Zopfia rhizophila CBS 207.26 TaxID=1314779 RepID=A0A6A6DAE1_9PEZI|nr:hypothetical protein K469DRAFT_69894 [Zopfia rhizophila CBS 207.26]